MIWREDRQLKRRERYVERLEREAERTLEALAPAFVAKERGEPEPPEFEVCVIDYDGRQITDWGFGARALLTITAPTAVYAYAYRIRPLERIKMPITVGYKGQAMVDVPEIIDFPFAPHSVGKFMPGSRIDVSFNIDGWVKA